MLHEEVKKYRELSGDTNPNTSISRIGGYLDGYEKALEETRWIPIGERLPEKPGTYMTTIDYGYGKYGLAVGQRYYYGSLGWNDDCVIAWMPLPEPYKAESEDKNDC